MSNALGKRIKLLRKEHNLTQLDFSKLVNIANTTLSQYESGKRIPSDDIKIKIANYFHVSVDYLLGQTDIRPLREAAKATYSLDTEGLTGEDIKIVEDIIKSIKTRRKAEKK